MTPEDIQVRLQCLQLLSSRSYLTDAKEIAAEAEVLYNFVMSVDQKSDPAKTLKAA